MERTSKKEPRGPLISPCQRRHGKYPKNLRHFVIPRILLCISENVCSWQLGTVPGSLRAELPYELPLAFYPFLFIPLREPTSAPTGHLLPEEGGRSVSPHQSLSRVGRKRCEYTVSPACHFERKREIFFAHGHERNGRISENGKHGTPYTPGSRRFMRALKIP